VQSYWQRAPHEVAQLLTWSHDTLQRSPQDARHVGPSWQPTTQSSAHVERHSPSKLAQSSWQGPGPQLWSQP